MHQDHCFFSSSQIVQAQILAFQYSQWVFHEAIRNYKFYINLNFSTDVLFQDLAAVQTKLSCAWMDNHYQGCGIGMYVTGMSKSTQPWYQWYLKLELAPAHISRVCVAVLTGKHWYSWICGTSKCIVALLSVIIYCSKPAETHLVSIGNDGGVGGGSCCCCCGNWWAGAVSLVTEPSAPFPPPPPPPLACAEPFSCLLSASSCLVPPPLGPGASPEASTQARSLASSFRTTCRGIGSSFLVGPDWSWSVCGSCSVEKAFFMLGLPTSLLILSSSSANLLW